jgi:hypothetical protein
MFMSTFSSGRSRVDLARWASELLMRCGFAREYGFHLILWEHDDGCPLNPFTNPGHELASQCWCPAERHSRAGLRHGERAAIACRARRCRPTGSTTAADGEVGVIFLTTPAHAVATVARPPKRTLYACR